MEIPAFFVRLCAGKQICNLKKEELGRYFPNEPAPIFLDDYDCLCVGYRGGRKCVERFRFLKCARKPLVGAHSILYRGEELHVDSLTYLKKEVFKFKDHVSFDRSTFLLLEKDKKVVRLLQLRARVQLHTFSGEYVDVKTPPAPVVLELPLVDTNGEIELEALETGFTQKMGEVWTHFQNTCELRDARCLMMEFLLRVWTDTIESVFTPHEMALLHSYFITPSQPSRTPSYWETLLDEREPTSYGAVFSDFPRRGDYDPPKYCGDADDA